MAAIEETDDGAVGARPFCKCLGGKTKLLPRLLAEVARHLGSRDGGTYHEPFVGGGALFWALAPRLRSARLADANADLVAAWQAVRDDVDGLVKKLRRMRNDEREFYRRRSRVPSDRLELAARFVYLNKTAFNGLWRVNAKGEHNAPFGRYENPRICDEPLLRACSAAMARVRRLEIEVAPFELAFRKMKPGDVAYLDPPYWPTSKTASFVAYGPGGFGPDAQRALRDLALAAKRRGVRVILSNADVPEVRALYADGFEVERVEARRNVNSDGAKRGPVGELIIT